MPTGKRVVIVGAGLAGLATALRLRRDDWNVVVAERAPALCGGGYMLNLGGLGYDAAERMGLIQPLRAAQLEPFELVYVDAQGRRLTSMNPQTQHALLGDRVLALFRGDIERVLYDALDDAVDFRFSTTVEHIVEHGDGVSVRFSDGDVVDADLLVGADGLHSQVRSLTFGPEPNFRYDFGTLVAINVLDAAPAVIKPGTGASMSLVRRGFSVLNPRGARPAAIFMFRSDQVESDLADGARTALHRRFGDLGWVTLELLDTVDGSDSVFFDQISQIRMDRWSRGRVVLLGDAAWCVSLFAGYGASLAFGGAELLGTVLHADPSDVARALRRWEQLLRPVAERRRRQGRRLRSAFVAPNSVSLRARTQLLRLADSRVGTGVMRRVLGVPAPAEKHRRRR